MRQLARAALALALVVGVAVQVTKPRLRGGFLMLDTPFPSRPMLMFKL